LPRPFPGSRNHASHSWAISHRRCDASRSGTRWNFRVSGRGGRLVDDRFIRGSQAAVAPQLERLSVRAIPLGSTGLCRARAAGLFKKELHKPGFWIHNGTRSSVRDRRDARRFQ
jgi:hypothetical protein